MRRRPWWGRGGEGRIIRRLRRLTPFGAARRLRRLRVLSPPGGGSSRTLDELLTHTHFPGVVLKPLGHLSGGNWRRPDQPHPGTRVRCCRCSLPGLTGFTTCRREGTGGVTIVAGRIVASGWGMWQVTVPAHLVSRYTPLETTSEPDTLGGISRTRWRRAR